MKHVLTAIPLVLLVGWASHPLTATSAPVTVYIEAEVYEVVDTLGLVTGQVQPGSIITGSYTVDPDTIDENASLSVGTYRHHAGPYGIDLSVGGSDSAATRPTWTSSSR